MNRKYYLAEVWLPIEGYKGLYDVSNYGRIRCMDFNKEGRTEILHIHALKGHYKMVGLRTGDKYRYFMVHRLVAQAFLSLPNKGETIVEHIDGNPQNNYVKCEIINGDVYVHRKGTNLRWIKPQGRLAYEKVLKRRSEFRAFPTVETRQRMSEGQKRRFARERETRTGRYAARV